MLTVPNIGNKFHNLDSCILGQSGIQHLAKGKQPNLEEIFMHKGSLNLDSNYGGYEGYATLGQSNWSKLGQVDINEFLMGRGCVMNVSMFWHCLIVQCNIKKEIHTKIMRKLKKI